MTWIDAFILLALVVMWCWNLPDDSPAKRALRPFNNFILHKGMWHDWTMFAPDPLCVNRTVCALVTVKAGIGPKPPTSDGNPHEHGGGEVVLEWSPPDAAGKGAWAEFVASRERKLIDNLLCGQLPYLPLALASYVARQYQATGHDVLKVELVEIYRYVPPPEKCHEAEDFKRNLFWTFVPPRPEAPPPSPPSGAPSTAATVYVTNAAQPTVSQVKAKRQK